MENSSVKYSLWLCDLTHDRQTVALNSIPLGIGMLAAYINKKLPGKFDIRLFKFPDDLIENCLNRLPHIIGFSNYLWNSDIGSEIARNIKERSASTVVIFGGPNFPWDRNERYAFLSKRAMIDFYIHGEGEEALYCLLNSLIQNDLDINKVKTLQSPNTCSILSGEFVLGDNAARMDINEIPSPYLEGLLDKFFTPQTMPLIQTNRGCPFSCTYCTEGKSYYNKISFKDIDHTIEEIRYIAKKNIGSQNLNIADSNFGMHKRDIEICRAIAEVQDTYNWPKYIHVAVGKNNKKRVLEAVRIIRGALRLSASVQSMDPIVLENIRRKNISPVEIIETAQEGKTIGSNTYAEVILALPGDTKEAHFRSVEYLVNAGVNYIRSYTLMVLKGAPLASQDERNKYGMVTKYRVVPRCFGTYRFGNGYIHSLEIEEVCVANDTLSFDDYLECRVLALITELFYNDSIMHELLTLLKEASISPYKLLKRIYDSISTFPESLVDLFNSFKRETEDELWEAEEEIYEFARNESVVDKYLSGEYGSNLIFKYKALGMINHLDEIYEVAFNVAQELIGQDNDILNNESIAEFLNELKRYSILQKKNLFNIDESFTEIFHFDLDTLKSGKLNRSIEEIRLSRPVQVFFEHSKDQKEVIKGAINEFGSDLKGIIRILSRIHISKTYRGCIPVNIYQKTTT